MPLIAPSVRRRSAALLAAAGLTLLAACGGTADGGTADGGSAATASSSPAPTRDSAPAAPSSAEEAGGTITVTGVDFDLELDSTELAAGEYEFEFVNDGGASHDVRIEQDGEDVAQSEIIAPGETATFSATLEPGEYVFYCSVGAHRGMGMETTVTVT